MKRVLIADDAMFMRTMLKDILTKNGYEIAGEAGNGKEAYEQYESLKPDIVTMDITFRPSSALITFKKWPDEGK